jgi:hypothetical protein
MRAALLLSFLVLSVAQIQRSSDSSGSVGTQSDLLKFNAATNRASFPPSKLIVGEWRNATKPYGTDPNFPNSREIYSADDASFRSGVRTIRREHGETESASYLVEHEDRDKRQLQLTILLADGQQRKAVFTFDMTGTRATQRSYFTDIAYVDTHHLYVRTKTQSSIANEGGAKATYSIVDHQDISMKALTKHLSSYQLDELAKLPRNTRFVYRILVPSDISREALKTAMIRLVEKETARNPDIDEIAVFAYDRLQDVGGAYTFGKLEWCPYGDWASVTPTIARSNDRTNYKYKVDIKKKVGDPTSRPTEREFRTYDTLSKALWADPDVPEDEVMKKIAEQLDTTVDELDRVYKKVAIYQSE